MLSFITLHKNGWQQHSYVALDGVAEHAMLHVLSKNMHIKNVVLCLDHDPAGIEASGRLAGILHEKGYACVSCLQPACKDWNEDLKAQHGITPIPAKPHPKIEACKELCGEIRYLCSHIKSVKNPHEMLMEHYEKAVPLMQSSRSIDRQKAVLMEQLLSMAAYALFAVMVQYRQLEKLMNFKQLTDELCRSYHPHQDRGKMKTKAEDIQRDVDAINAQLNISGIRTLEDKQKLIASYMSLALNCVKAQIFICLKNQEQKMETLEKQNEERVDYMQAVCEEFLQHNI
jgi:DNA primase